MPAHPKPERLPEASPYAVHIPALDGVRGLAVLGVIGSHVFPGNTSNPLTQALRSMFNFGATGVDLFFVLSGFLITGILFDSLGEKHYFRKFYARRILRIFPLYYGVLALYALGALFLNTHFRGELASLALFLQNTGLVAAPIYAYVGPSALPLSHFWSLAIEEQFYLIWSPIVFLLIRRTRLLFVCIVLFLLCPLLRVTLLLGGWGYAAVHNNTLLRADTLLAGAALALLLRSRWHDRTLRAGPWLVLMGGLCTAALIAGDTSGAIHVFWWFAAFLSLRYTFLAMLFAGFLALSLRVGMVSRVCGWRLLRFFGKYSYGLYVMHLILFSYADGPLRYLIAEHLTRNKAAGVGLTGIVCFALSVLAAVLSYQLYEKRFLSLKRFFSYTKHPAGRGVPTAGDR